MDPKDRSSSLQAQRKKLVSCIDQMKLVVRLKEIPDFVDWIQSWSALIDKEVLRDVDAKVNLLESQGKRNVIKRMRRQLEDSTGSAVEKLVAKLRELDNQIDKKAREKDERGNSRTDFLGVSGTF